jgi:hypothetical protein
LELYREGVCLWEEKIRMKNSMMRETAESRLAHTLPNGLSTPGFIRKTNRVTMAGQDRCVGGEREKTRVPHDAFL